MTAADHPVTRCTVNSYRVSLTGADRTPCGRRLVITIHGDQHGDYITIREHRRRHRVTLDVSALYRRAILSEHATTKRSRR